MCVVYMRVHIQFICVCYGNLMNWKLWTCGDYENYLILFWKLVVHICNCQVFQFQPKLYTV
jgi:hypothetical protein